MKHSRILIGLASVLYLSLALCAPAIAKRPVAKPIKNKPSVQLVPPSATVEGKNFEQWSVAWWQWVYSIPTTPDSTGNSANPLWDTKGAYGMVGQSGNVLFLVGTQGGGVVRDITILPGRYLFFPLVNFEDDNVDWENFGKPHEFTPQELEAELRSWVAVTNLAQLKVVVDGVEVSQKELLRGLVISPIFAYWLPPEAHVYGAGYDILGIKPSGWVCPAISGGWWAMLKPLSVGTHTLTFGGGVLESPWGAFSTEASYNITVADPCATP